MKININDISVGFINLDEHKDRLHKIESNLKALNFKSVTRIPGVKALTGPIGLAKAQQYALESLQLPFILLEDDAEPFDFRSEIVVPDDADAVYLGTSNWALQGKKVSQFLRFSKTKYPGVYRIKNMLSTHAILYISEAWKAEVISCCVSSQIEPYLPIDINIANKQNTFNIYCLDSPMFVQGIYKNSMSSASDWTNRKLTDYPRSLKFGPFILPLNIKSVCSVLDKQSRY